jgi:hypothetical protein
MSVQNKLQKIRQDLARRLDLAKRYERDFTGTYVLRKRVKEAEKKP